MKYLLLWPENAKKLVSSGPRPKSAASRCQNHPRDRRNRTNDVANLRRQRAAGGKWSPKRPYCVSVISIRSISSPDWTHQSNEHPPLTDTETCARPPRNGIAYQVSMPMPPSASSQQQWALRSTGRYRGALTPTTHRPFLPLLPPEMT